MREPAKKRKPNEKRTVPADCPDSQRAIAENQGKIPLLMTNSTLSLSRRTVEPIKKSKIKTPKNKLKQIEVNKTETLEKENSEVYDF